MKFLLVACLAFAGIQCSAAGLTPDMTVMAVPSNDLVADLELQQMMQMERSLGQERATCRVPDVCIDKWSNCDDNVASGACNNPGSFRDKMALNCKKACGWCDGVPEPDTCFDKWSNCDDNVASGACDRPGSFRDKMAENCKKACGWCDGVPELTCFDVYSNCQQLDNDYNACTAYKSFMTTKCDKFCGYCS